MPVRFSLDSNVLVYAADDRDPARQGSALDIITRAAQCDCVLTPQALSEFFHAVTRKGIMPRMEAAEQVRDWITTFTVTPGATAASVLTAAQASAAGRFQFYDALLLATARDAGCSACISEDMADGAALDGVRVVTAFGGHGVIGADAVALLGG
ncbi:MAG TPA: PIN domain-containing protein [Acetobacteraceae bacterium]|nr:PIN domain-containing protein [Acetobacteraceae bacterium]